MLKRFSKNSFPLRLAERFTFAAIVFTVNVMQMSGLQRRVSSSIATLQQYNKGALHGQ